MLLERQEPLPKALVTKRNRSSNVQVTIITVPKANLYEMTTVIQLARESVGLCPIPWFTCEGIRVITQLSKKKKKANRIINITHRESYKLNSPDHDMAADIIS